MASVFVAIFRGELLTLDSHKFLSEKKQKDPKSTNTFPDTNIAPEEWWLVRRLFSFGDVIAGSMLISEMVSCSFDREGYFAKFSPNVCGRFTWEHLW